MIRGVDKRHSVKTAGGRVDQWFSDAAFAAFVARWAGISKGERVLDFGAGTGALSRAALGVGALVTAVEIDQRLEAKLRANAPTATVVIADLFDPALLNRIPQSARRDRGLPYDYALGNPPWSKSNEARFTRRALDFAPRAISIVSQDAMCGREKAACWREMRVTRELVVPSRLSFSLDGSTGQENCVALVVELRAAPRTHATTDVIARSYYEPPRRA